MKKSMLSGWSSIPGGILFLEIMYICTLGFTRYRALLSADADGTLVNRPRKTNATFGGACFFWTRLHNCSMVLRAGSGQQE